MVEMGHPVRVTSITVIAAPRPTANRNEGSCVSVSGTNPFPLNAFTNRPESSAAAQEPSKVVPVAHHRAWR